MKEEELDRPMLAIPYIKANYKKEKQSARLIEKFTNPEIYLQEFDEVYNEFLSINVLARNIYIEEKLEQVKDEFEQLLILSAGLDTKVDVLDSLKDKKAFGLDIAAKDIEDIYTYAGVETKLKIIYCDLEKDVNDELMNTLISEGFNPKKRTFLLWEGGTFLVDRDSIKNTLTFLIDQINIPYMYVDYMSKAVFEPATNPKAIKYLQFVKENLVEFKAFYTKEEIRKLYIDLGYSDFEISELADYERFIREPKIDKEAAYFTFAKRI